MPARYDLEVYQGDDFVLPLQITVNGVAKDSTGSAFTASLLGPGEPIPFVIDETDLTTSRMRLILPAATTVALDPDTTYRWDWQETNAENFVTTWLHGLVTVKKQVTV